jgi:cobalt/nickel transport system permease protein
MHIPDGFLTPPVWAALDVGAMPVVGYFLRRTQRTFEQSRIPLLGVLGAFVFAAQMINFPIWTGTSGHLVGGALLALTLGPSAAVVVMTAILVVQSLVFQDGGLLALGANVLNMAVIGVWAGYLPAMLLARGTGSRRLAAFIGGWLSLMAGALLASIELWISQVAPPAPLFTSMLGLHALTGLAEGSITAASLVAIEKLNPGFVHAAAAGRPHRSAGSATGPTAKRALAGRAAVSGR